MGLREWGPVFLVLVIALITGIPISSIYFVFTENLSRAVWMPFILPVLMLWTNYFLGVMTSPGYVPKDYDPSVPASTVTSDGLQHPSTDNNGPTLVHLKKSAKKWRWCRKCNVYKPPRTHHCRECRKCVLKMDHHCPWLNNCVGHRNSGHFLRFLLWTTTSVIYCLTLHGIRLFDLLQYQLHLEAMRRGDYITAQQTPIMFVNPADTLEVYIMVVNVVLLIVLVFTVGLLTGFQVYYAMTNVTTIENMENDKIVDLMNKGRIPKVAAFPYDLGWYRNMCQILGVRWWFWLVPQVQAGDGTVFPINDNLGRDNSNSSNGGSKSVMWPPEEYYRYKKDPYGLSRRDKDDDDAVSQDTDVDDDDDYDEADDYKSDGKINKPRYATRVDIDNGNNQDDDDDDKPIARTHHGRKLGRHVRRGSEGYVVREFTAEERDAMIRTAMERQQVQKPVVGPRPNGVTGLMAGHDLLGDDEVELDGGGDNVYSRAKVE
ncbi:hypothetical protein SmJEL517_g05255 [Synchytrium microbalum]|uniref:Palmitoyltransferase n=1 Tax=Synchytrium microbalum TaxID=1806994 RepID=A0A507C044_9FUNG|nr:uncharacterized protein SmJEL517_g05255 [Synchytrium microbalum]TPX31424.1 hypothetical protein SmJEL517_g05255 [Synchytrium microbalum]